MSAYRPIDALRRASTALVLSVAAAALGAAMLLVPGRHERIAMAMADGHFQKALSLSDQQPSTELGVNELLERYRLDIHFGQRSKATDALKAVVDLVPDQAWARRLLADHYRQVGDFKDYLDTLRLLLDLSPTRETLVELMGRYRLNGNQDAELELFEFGLRENLVDAKDILRAGLVYAAVGKLERSATLLAKLDTTTSPEFPEAQLTHFYVLVDLGRYKEALILGLQLSRIAKFTNHAFELATAFDCVGKADYAALFRRAVLDPAKAIDGPDL